jgi:hypothetical protein
MDGATDTVVGGIRPEEGAGLGKFFEYAHVRIKVQFIGVYFDSLSLACILVAYDEFDLADLLLDGKNRSEVAAAFAALKAFKTQKNLSSSFRQPYRSESIELRLSKRNLKQNSTAPDQSFRPTKFIQMLNRDDQLIFILSEKEKESS